MQRRELPALRRKEPRILQFDVIAMQDLENDPVTGAMANAILSSIFRKAKGRAWTRPFTVIRLSWQYIRGQRSE
ncbi:hypothetical protein thsrh120_63910 [Rhizobium sp. No.120]